MIRTIVDHVATSVLMASLAKTSHVSVVLVKNLATRHVLILLPPTVRSCVMLCYVVCGCDGIFCYD